MGGYQSRASDLEPLKVGDRVCLNHDLQVGMERCGRIESIVGRRVVVRFPGGQVKRCKIESVSFHPTPSEIRQRCLAVQEEWTDAASVKRRFGTLQEADAASYEIPQVSDSFTAQDRDWDRGF